jgi:hypothetical protein
VLLVPSLSLLYLSDTWVIEEVTTSHMCRLRTLAVELLTKNIEISKMFVGPTISNTLHLEVLCPRNRILRSHLRMTVARPRCQLQ